jgi:hypothetical protein
MQPLPIQFFNLSLSLKIYQIFLSFRTLSKQCES